MPSFIETAVILRVNDVTGRPIVVSNDNLENIKTDTEGFLYSFKHKGIDYVFLKRDNMSMDDFNEPQNYLRSGYYPDNTFLNYRLESHEYSRDVTLGKLNKLKFNEFKLINGNAEILLNRIKITFLQGEFLTHERFWITYHPTHSPIILTNLGRVSVEDALQVSGSQWTPPFYSLGDVFYANHIHYATDDFELSESDTKRRARAIILIAMKIDYIIDEVFSLLDPNDVLVQLIIQEQKNFWSSQDIFVNPTTETILKYDDGMRSFYLQGSSDRLKIEDEDRMASLYRLMSILNWSAFSVLEFDLRIKLLKLLANSGNLEEHIGWRPINYEHIVENLILSFSGEEADRLLDALINEKVYLGITLFEYIFQEVNDSGFDKDALKHIMEHLCYLWLVSKYSFYFEGLPETNFPLNENDEPELTDVLSFMRADNFNYNENVVTPQLYSNKPIEFDYTSEEFAWLFHDTSHDFTFDGELIVAAKDAPTNISGQLYSEFKAYHIYQGITVSLKNETTKLKHQFSNITVNGVESCIMPIFYLAYFDYNKTIENITTAVELTLDLILTISGVGNILKLRHLFKMNKLGRMLMMSEGILSSEVAEYYVARGFIGALEVSSTVAHYYVQYQLNGYGTYCDPDSPNADAAKCQWYQDFSNWLLIIQLSSGALDGVQSAIVQKGARRLINNINNAPEDFLQDGIHVLRKFAVDDEDTFILFRAYVETKLGQNFDQYGTSFWAKFENLPENERYDFVFDFEKADFGTFSKLNLDNNLVDQWLAIKHLRKERKDVIFLVNYRTVVNHPRLTDHVHIGHAGVGATGGAWVTGNHNPFNMDNTALWRWENGSSVANSKGYEHGFIERNMQDHGWSGGNGSNVSSWKRKKDATTFWRKFSDNEAEHIQRVNEEMAYALTNKTFVRKERARNGLYRDIYSGVATDGQKIEIILDSDTKDIISIYPGEI